MKPQQKRFVVEIKSKGRLSTVRQGSIWGTTDFKALAQQAASVAPQLFDTTGDVTETVVMSTPQSQDTAPPAPVDFSDTVQPESAGELELVSVDTVETETPQAQAVALYVQTDVVQKPKSDGPHRAEKSSRVKTAVSEAKASQSLNASSDDEDHDLDLLEAENVRLKFLWAERLREENWQLRAMLERFLSL